MTDKRSRTEAFDRIRQALWAGLITFALCLLTIPALLDQFIWISQSQLASFRASGEIVYVGANEDLADPDFPHRRKQLAQLIEKIDRSGAEAIYVDIVFDQSSDVEADKALNVALRSLDERGYLIRNYATGLNGVDAFRKSIPTIRRDMKEVGRDFFHNYLGIVWHLPYVVTDGETSLPSLSAVLAGTEHYSHEQFPVSYLFDLESIPMFEFNSIAASPELPSQLQGRQVVIGIDNRSDANAPSVPGHLEVPSSLIHIYGAETLLADQTGTIGYFLCLVAMLALLGLVCRIEENAHRRWAYGALVLAVPVAIMIASFLGLRISAASSVFLLAVFGAFRARNLWKKSFRLIDEDTSLPTFAALEKDSEVATTVPAIIVAKIHRFEEVRKSLPQSLHAEYLLRIVDRLRAAKHDVTIYAGPGHLIAWTFPEKEPALIKEHLEGLRALFSAPLQVGDAQVDVSVTFGVDITPSPVVSRRLAAAVSAAERTTETYEPIEIAELASDEDLIWNISLQARIDAALANGEIYLIYQPKVLVKTGELVGVEALVRWRDPDKGLIPPDHFIRQCENAGRMSHLTRHVLREACNAGNAFDAKGLVLPISVNISATLIHERTIIDMVREVLEETGFEPHRLTLEITETYRISNFERAREILEDLAALGPKLSMDDFGVGAASLEALQSLPFDELKIDKIFTMAMKQDPKSAAIVRNVLLLGKDLRMVVVAEGVEDEATLEMLRRANCLVAQGFGISRPVPFSDILHFQRLTPLESTKKIG